jgi:hypothetical protein
VAAARRELSPKYRSKVRGTVLVVEDAVLVRMVIADNYGMRVIQSLRLPTHTKHWTWFAMATM